jgi:InsA C-terminal domain
VPEVKQQLIDMSLNANGVRDNARVLRISTDTVLSELQKREAALESVSMIRLCTVNPEDFAVHIEPAGEAEMDEMWSFVARKRNSGGYGMPSITALEPSWQMSLAAAKTKFSCG